MHGIFGQILAILGTTVVLVVLFRRAGLPSVLAYLAVGIVFGPSAAAILAPSPAMAFLGEIGVAFLLFTIGLEFSLAQFMAMRGVLLGLGGLQVLLGTASGALIASAFGVPPAAAFVLGGALALSSTAIVVKQLVDQAELQERHGGIALGILLFQDLAAVPFLVVIPIFAAGTSGALAGAMALAFVKAIAAFMVLLMLGRFVLRPLFHEVGSARSGELFNLTVLLVSLLAAWVTEQLGLSLALGAFLAGMMLSETEFRHQIEAELRPFKDLLLGLFFITVGMQLDLAALPLIWPWIALLVLGLVVGKGGLIVLLSWLWIRDTRAALRAGCVLAHGGEFGFALMALALATGLLSSADAQPVLGGIVVSMLIAPLMVRHNAALARWLLPPAAPGAEHTSAIAAAAEPLTDHVIICGFGRVGRQVASLLDAVEIPFVAIDHNAAAVKAAWEDGRSVFYGDATDSAVLEAAGLARARALVLSFDTDVAAIRTLQQARRLSECPRFVRARDEQAVVRLRAAGASDIVAETLAASLELGADLLDRLGVESATVEALLHAEQERHYRGEPESP